jgi:hypothetical protein
MSERQLDQLDVQCHVEVQQIRADTNRARQRLGIELRDYREAPYEPGGMT